MLQNVLFFSPQQLNNDEFDHWNYPQKGLLCEESNRLQMLPGVTVSRGEWICQPNFWQMISVSLSESGWSRAVSLISCTNFSDEHSFYKEPHFWLMNEAFPRVKNYLNYSDIKQLKQRVFVLFVRSCINKSAITFVSMKHVPIVLIVAYGSNMFQSNVFLKVASLLALVGAEVALEHRLLATLVLAVLVQATLVLVTSAAVVTDEHLRRRTYKGTRIKNNCSIPAFIFVHLCIILFSHMKTF